MEGFIMSSKSVSRIMSYQGVKNNKKLRFSFISKSIARIRRYMKMKSTDSMFFIDNKYKESEEKRFFREVILLELHKTVL